MSEWKEGLKMLNEQTLSNVVSETTMSPKTALRSLLMALDSGDVTTAILTLDTRFKFTDYALGVEFNETPRLGDFWQAVREVLTGTKVEIVSIAESADCAFAEWHLTGTTEEGYGTFKVRHAVSVHGVSVAHVTNGRITQLSDYYDSAASRRYKVAGQFTEWVEY